MIVLDYIKRTYHILWKKIGNITSFKIFAVDRKTLLRLWPRIEKLISFPPAERLINHRIMGGLYNEGNYFFYILGIGSHLEYYRFLNCTSEFEIGFNKQPKFITIMYNMRRSQKYPKKHRN